MPSPESRLLAFCNVHFPATTFKLEHLQGDASTRMYVRLKAESSSMIAALYPEPFTAAESPYLSLTDLFERSAIPVPGILVVDGERGVIAQQDLGDIRVQDYLKDLDETAIEALYRQALAMIVRIQQATDTAWTEDSISSRLAFDEEKLFWELNFFYQNYFVNFLQERPAPEIETLLLGEFSALARRLANVPRVLCHRDYHSRNLMVAEDKLWVIDHQDARMGPGTYDVASLLADPYVSLSDEMQERLKDYFFEIHTAALGTRCYSSRVAFEDEYRLMLIQRFIKALGTFSNQAAVRGNPTYLPYMQPSFATVRKALEHVADMPFTKKMVKEHAERTFHE